MNAPTEPVLYFPAQPFSAAREIQRQELRELLSRREEARAAYNAATLWAWVCIALVVLSAGIGVLVLRDGQYFAAVMSAVIAVSFGRGFLQRLPVIGEQARELERLAARYEADAKDFWDASEPIRPRRSAE